MSVQIVEAKVIKCDSPGCEARVHFDALNLSAPQYEGWTINHMGDKDFCPRHALQSPEPPQDHREIKRLDDIQSDHQAEAAERRTEPPQGDAKT